MRVLIGIAVLVLAGCSSDGEANPADGTCSLLTAADVAVLLHEDDTDSRAGETGGLPHCQWEADDGTYVQAVSVDASDWARVLPDIIRALEASGLVQDSENTRKLREGAALIESGQELTSDAACALFSEMVELQGAEPGATMIVNVVPNREAPQAVTGQICADGRYTSVMVARPQGLSGTSLPLEDVEAVATSAHDRATR